MQEYLIPISGLKKGSLTKICLVLLAARIRTSADTFPAYLRDSEPNAVIVHPDDVALAAGLIHALGFDTLELSEVEELKTRVRTLERGIKVVHHELAAMDKEWGYSEDDPKYKKVMDTLQALLK